jgi:agmatine deiminase
MTTNNRRFPAEWENQQGILLCFPHNGQTGQENTKRFNGRLLNSSKKWLLMKRYFSSFDDKLKEKVSECYKWQM